MAQRFGGAHSPDAQKSKSLSRAQPRRFTARVRILYFLPLPLLFLALSKTPLAMAIDVAACAILILAAFLLQEGIRAEDAYNDRKVARRPAIPRKIFASVLTGVGVALAAMEGLSGLIAGVGYGVIAAGLHGFTFGLDPMKDKGMEGIDTFQTDRVAAAIEKAEGLLAEMQDAALRARDRSVMDRVATFQDTAREMFRTVEDDPRDLSAARKFLGIYLSAARDATVKFADLFSASGDEGARIEYYALLDDLEASFVAKRERLMLADKQDLDIEIEVLRDRLKRDGLLIRDEGDLS